MTRFVRIALLVHKRLSLAVTAQALSDCLRFALNEPIEAVCDEEQFDAYNDARAFIARYPTLEKRLKDRQQLKQWLAEIEKALGR